MRFMFRYDPAAARREAPIHVQVKLTDLPATDPDGFARVGGEVVRVFRGETALRHGASIEFRLWMCRRGREPTGPAYAYYEDLVAKGYMEAYLEGSPPDCRLVAYEFCLLSEPSDDPRLRVDDLDRSLPVPKKWWQFWRSLL